MSANAFRSDLQSPYFCFTLLFFRALIVFNEQASSLTS